jgi:3-isopropylmalate/(R)-2-methylmalate dehydratase small subunit
MKPVTQIQSRTVVLPNKDIDTDQIIPARFLTTTSREGLGNAAFYDLRYNDSADCSVLVAGNNFGCGSSREHAPWALLDYGFKAVISTEIADIFRSNSLKNGLIPVIVDSDIHTWLLDNPGIIVTIDIETATLTLPGERVIEFPIDGFARFCLLNGIDQLGFLQKHRDQISRFEEIRSWKP